MNYTLCRNEGQGDMEKTIYTREYRVLLDLLKTLREKSGFTQTEMAQKLKITQSYFSKLERGERTMDVIELRTICGELGTSLPKFINKFEKQLKGN